MQTQGTDKVGDLLLRRRTSRGDFSMAQVHLGKGTARGGDFPFWQIFWDVRVFLNGPRLYFSGTA